MSGTVSIGAVVIRLFETFTVAQVELPEPSVYLSGDGTLMLSDGQFGNIIFDTVNDFIGNATLTFPHETWEPDTTIEDADSVDAFVDPYPTLAHFLRLLRANQDPTTRHYSSSNTSDGPFGLGWSAGFDTRLEVHGDGSVEVIPGDGHPYGYEPGVGLGEFDSPPGIFNELRETTEGYEERDPTGGIRFFNETGVLQATENRFGHRSDLFYDSCWQLEQFTDRFGRLYFITWTPDERYISKITDFAGREVDYNYDLANGLLIGVVGASTGNPADPRSEEHYNYAETTPGVFQMTDVVYPNQVADGSETPTIGNTYGSGIPGDEYRVTIQQLGFEPGGTGAGGGSGGILRITPLGGPGPNAPAGTETTTIVTDRVGNIAFYHYDADGFLIGRGETNDVGGIEATTIDRNADGLPTQITNPGGGILQLTWDELNPSRFSQANLLEWRQIADPLRGGDGLGAPIADRVCTATYEPVFNQRRTVTGVMGHTTEFLYDWQEGPNAPSDAQDWNIGVDPALLGFGDLNGDGRTDQQMGTLARIDWPDRTPFNGAPLQAATLVQSNNHAQTIQVEDPRGNTTTCQYYPENDPDGDGLDIIPGGDPTTGGYLQQITIAGELMAPRIWSFERDRHGNCTSATDPEDNTTKYLGWRSHWGGLPGFRPSRIEPPSNGGFGTDFFYDANGRCTEVRTDRFYTDVDGNEILLDPAQKTDRYFYNLECQLVRVECDATRPATALPSNEPETLITSWQRDGNGCVLRCQSRLANASGNPASDPNAVEYERNFRGRVIAETRAPGSADESTRTWLRNSDGQVIQLIDAEDNDGDGLPETTTIIRNGFGWPVSSTDRLGNENVRTHNPRGQVTSTEWFGPIDGSGGPNVLLGGRDSFFDELGGCIGFDNRLFLPQGTSTTYPSDLIDGSLIPGDGSINERRVLNELGLPVSIIDDQGNVTSHQYNGANELVRIDYPVTDTSTGETMHTDIERDNNGCTIRSSTTFVDPEGISPSKTTDNFIQRDNRSRPRMCTNSLGDTRYFCWENIPLAPTRVSLADESNLLHKSYDSLGPDTTVTDPTSPLDGMTINLPGHETTYERDCSGRTCRTSYSNGIPDCFSVWNANSRCIERRSEGLSTIWEYDACNRRTARHNSDADLTSGTGRGSILWFWGRDHQLNQRIDENNSQFDYTCDVMNRRLRTECTPAPLVIPGTVIPIFGGTTVKERQYNGWGGVTQHTNNNDPSDPNDDVVVTNKMDSVCRTIEKDQNDTVIGFGYVGQNRSQVFYPCQGAGPTVAQYSHDSLNQVSDVQFLFQGTLYCAAEKRGILGRERCTTFWERDAANPGLEAGLEQQTTLDGLLRPVVSNWSTAQFDFLGGFDMTQSINGFPLGGYSRTGRIQGIEYTTQHPQGITNSTHQIFRDNAQRMTVWTHEFGTTLDPFGPSQFREFTYSSRNEVATVFAFDGIEKGFHTFSHNDGHEINENDYTGDAGTGIRTFDSAFGLNFNWTPEGNLNRILDVAENVLTELDRDANGTAVRTTDQNGVVTETVDGKYDWWVARSDVGTEDSEDKPATIYFSSSHNRWVIEAPDVYWEQQQAPPVVKEDGEVKEFNIPFFSIRIRTNTAGSLCDDPSPTLSVIPTDPNGTAMAVIECPAGDNPSIGEFYTYPTTQQPQILDPVGNPQSGSNFGQRNFFGGQLVDPTTGFNISPVPIDPITNERIGRNPSGHWANPGSYGNGFAVNGGDPWAPGPNRTDIEDIMNLIYCIVGTGN